MPVTMAIPSHRPELICWQSDSTDGGGSVPREIPFQEITGAFEPSGRIGMIAKPAATHSEARRASSVRRSLSSSWGSIEVQKLGDIPRSPLEVQDLSSIRSTNHLFAPHKSGRAYARGFFFAAVART
jgi:hypothetical protein